VLLHGPRCFDSRAEELSNSVALLTLIREFERSAATPDPVAESRHGGNCLVSSITEPVEIRPVQSGKRKLDIALPILIVSLAAAALFALSGCSSPQPMMTNTTATPPTATPAQSTKSAETVAPAVPTEIPTVSVAPDPATPSATAVAPAGRSVAAAGDGRTYPGPFFLGRADAPVTIDEYADFQ
jgi:hypothetical protein